MRHPLRKNFNLRKSDCGRVLCAGYLGRKNRGEAKNRTPQAGSPPLLDPSGRDDGRESKTHSVFTVDPTTRTIGRPVNAALEHTQGFRSLEARKAAGSIFNRSFERTNRGMTSSLSNVGRQNGMNFQQGQGRSFSAPNVTHERSFSTAPRTGEGSFSHPSRSFGASPSFSEGSRGFSSSRSVASPAVVFTLVVSPVEAGASTVVAAVDNEIGAKSSAKSKRGSHGPLFLSLPPPIILTCGIIV